MPRERACSSHPMGPSTLGEGKAPITSEDPNRLGGEQGGPSNFEVQLMLDNFLHDSSHALNLEEYLNAPMPPRAITQQADPRDKGKAILIASDDNNLKMDDVVGLDLVVELPMIGNEMVEVDAGRMAEDRNRTGGYQIFGSSSNNPLPPPNPSSSASGSSSYIQSKLNLLITAWKRFISTIISTPLHSLHSLESYAIWKVDEMERLDVGNLSWLKTLVAQLFEKARNYDKELSSSLHHFTSASQAQMKEQKISAFKIILERHDDECKRLEAVKIESCRVQSLLSSLERERSRRETKISSLMEEFFLIEKKPSRDEDALKRAAEELEICIGKLVCLDLTL